MSANINLKAIQSIQNQRDFTFPPKDGFKAQIKDLCAMVIAGFRLDAFPDADASFAEVGSWVSKQMKLFVHYMIRINPNHEALRIPQSPNPDYVRNLVRSNEAFKTIVISSVRKFLQSASTYAQQRQISAQKQLRNQGRSADEIKTVLEDPNSVREFVQQQRLQLVDQLTRIKGKMDSNDPLNLLTEKERKLWDKHSVWFSSNEYDDSSYLPNDNAVPYVFLILEVIQMLHQSHFTHLNELFDAYCGFCTVIMNAMNNESMSRAWKTVGTMPDHFVHGVNVGEVVRQYVGDATRTKIAARAVDNPALQTCTQRSIMRAERFCALSIPCKSPWTIMNLDVDDALRHLVDLHARERTTRADINQANNINSGIEAVSNAEAMCWYIFQDRFNLLPVLTGRNDISVPKLVKEFVGDAVKGLGDLPARKYSWAFSTAMTTMRSLSATVIDLVPLVEHYDTKEVVAQATEFVRSIMAKESGMTVDVSMDPRTTKEVVDFVIKIVRVNWMAATKIHSDETKTTGGSLGTSSSSYPKSRLNEHIQFMTSFIAAEKEEENKRKKPRKPKQAGKTTSTSTSSSTQDDEPP